MKIEFDEGYSGLRLTVDVKDLPVPRVAFWPVCVASSEAPVICDDDHLKHMVVKGLGH